MKLLGGANLASFSVSSETVAHGQLPKMVNSEPPKCPRDIMFQVLDAKTAGAGLAGK